MMSIAEQKIRASAYPGKSKGFVKNFTMLKNFIDLARKEVLSLVQGYGIDFNAVKGIEIETLVLVSPGRSIGVKRFVYPLNLGITRELSLRLGKNQVTTCLPKVQISGRYVGITVYL